MFAEYLKAHPLLPLLRPEGRQLFPSAEDQKAWKTILPDHREEIASLAAAYAEIPYPMRTATGFLAFVRDGSRQADEKTYFQRRRKLCASVLACCVDPDASLDPVIDGLWCILEETSWVISAHNVNAIPGAPSPAEYPLPDVDHPYVDLFSAQTGMILSLTVSLLGARLDQVTSMIRTRIQREIRQRILTPFLSTDDFWWMGVRRTDLNNWTPWILSNIMVCAILDPMPEDALSSLLERCCLMLDRWLHVVPEDGGCDEGAGYWNMAGGALLDCLELLEKVTGGRFSFRCDHKIRNILTFPAKAEIGNGWFVNFADCDARPFLSGERLQAAGEMLDDPLLISMGLRFRGTLSDQLNDVPHFTRLLSLLFHPIHHASNSKLHTPNSVWLPDLQLRLIRRGSLTLACKGGHNGENHNHNDVGSFMLYRDAEPVIVDAGNMVYTAKTFSAERYTLWNVRSAYHNLPLIGTHEQLPGREYAAREVCCLDEGLSLELAHAYGTDAGLRSLRRTLTLSEAGLILRDQLDMEHPQSITWVFLLRHMPDLKNGVVSFDALTLRYPPDCSPALEELPITDPRMARSFPGSLWRLTLTTSHTVTGGEFCFSIGKD